ncbi:MAG: transcription-repair coupling factor [Deltaproteobacteria bacterium]
MSFKIKPLNAAVQNSPGVARIAEILRADESSVVISPLRGSSKFYILAELARVASVRILYIASSAEMAQAASRDFAFFTGCEPPVLPPREFPSDDALMKSPSDASSMRLGWMSAAPQAAISIAYAEALFEKLPPQDLFLASRIRIKTGQPLSREDFISNLGSIGYSTADLVEKEGDMSARGGIVDFFSPAAGNPVRVEFLGDEVASLRYFSAGDQRSIERIKEAAALPAGEVILTPEAQSRAISWVQEMTSDMELSAPARRALIEKIKTPRSLPQIDWLMPLFYSQLRSPLDYISPDTVIVLDNPGGIKKSQADFLASLPRLDSLLRSGFKAAPAAEGLFTGDAALATQLSRFRRIILDDVQLDEPGAESVCIPSEAHPALPPDGRHSPFDDLASRIAGWKSHSFAVYIALQTEAEAKKFAKILAERRMRDVEIRIGAPSSGFILPEEGIALITEGEIFGERKPVKPSARRDVPSAFITSFGELKSGDYIVHAEFGIGIFRGLQRLKINSVDGDFIHCEYQGGDKVYVPVDKLKLVQRYICDGAPPRVDKLGHENWKKVIKRVRRAVETVAREILVLYAERKSIQGHQFPPRDAEFREFELSFPYEETSDQEAAIEDVMLDMESPKPMDRLICGDVGFGKTEVALRAAFKAAAAGKQVAFLAPTTLLVYQHYTTAAERLKPYPITVDMLSRFKTPRETKEILKKLEEGSLDIIIGTHKLLGDKIGFRDLGLLIIDEEQKFGVAHKEKLKRVKKGLDTLTLSATPIPRTLQLSLAGIRDVSLINTPPEGRQAVETKVCQYSPPLIREAIQREMQRGGCVFFIHNRIQDIYEIASRIGELVPEARIDVTHGKMDEERLEGSIGKFISGQTDVLVTTAIVESGLDIPRANTIIINEAEDFGLADLYQLRGRVGRSTKKAWAYLIVSRPQSLSPLAKRRLQAIVELRDLGAGYKLALSDLEIRGAGNLFGEAQSGHIKEVGLEMYLDMLDAAVRELKREDEGSAAVFEPEIKTHLPAFLSDDYISDERARLVYYKKISSLKAAAGARELELELGDRFGALPGAAENLLRIAEMKIEMERLFIRKIEITDEEAVIMFVENSPFAWRYRPAGRLRAPLKPGNPLALTMKVLGALARGEGVKSGGVGAS